MLTILSSLPEKLLQKKAHELCQHLQGPTLIHLTGVQPNPLFISVLLHGNETTGWEALKSYLVAQKNKPLARSLSIFIANVSAAEKCKRVLDGQPDYNRVWRNHPSEEGRMMNKILLEMEQKQIFASIDIHNNTGKNPHYACINQKQHDFFQLAHLFSRTVVYFTQPDSVQSMAFSSLCPAVTIECGQPDQPHGVEHVKSYIEKIMVMGEFSQQALKKADFDLYHTMAIVKVPEQFSISFDSNQSADISFDCNVDRLNFTVMRSGECLALIDPHKPIYLQAVDEQGKNVSQRYFSYDNGEIRTQIQVMPSMLTTKEEIIRQDCLCYLMEKMTLPAVENIS
ncbi:MAG: succinylglutamate desuccinylase/aspartoacylase family protein [gamma proteobacterium symbiont of Taylorina sp.]|nr:succinylglutamate desuccinylase/aspartoacylase family protein [gamma proteobacterium symbiont of Taylorina sp.]